MKNIKWKILIITSLVCVLPVLFGMSVWENLPDTIAIHFDISGNPDNFASKEFAVFGITLIMLGFQWISCIACDASRKYSDNGKYEMIAKWIIPVISIVLQIVMIGYSIGWNIDVRKITAFLVGSIFIVTGSCMPGFDSVKHMKMDKEKARKFNRFVGRATVILGILFLVSAFLPSVAMVVCLLLMIPYAIISVAYGIVIARKEVEK